MTRTLLSLTLALSLSLFGCGDGGTTDSSGDTTTGADGATTMDGVTPSDGAGPSDDGGAPEPEDDGGPSADTPAPPADITVNPEDNHGHALATAPRFGEACEQNSRVGHFQVTHDEFYAAVTGTVASGVIPLTVLQPVQEVGDCKMLRKVNPFCDPPCSGGDLCKHDGTCIPYPANQGVGTATVTGLLKDPLTMEPNASNYYTDVQVPFPLFEPEAQIDLMTTGDDLEGFALRAWGVPSVELPDVIWEMEAGQPLTVEWIAEPGPWKMLVSLNVDQHGNSPVTMFCEVDDNGSTVVGAALVDELLSYGVSGFATADFRRSTVDSLQLGDVGCVQLSVESLKLGKLTVAGHTPCKTPLDCPEGYECNFPIETCEPIE